MHAVPEPHFHVGNIPNDFPIWSEEIAKDYAERDGDSFRTCTDAACIDPEEQRAWHRGQHDDCPICRYYQGHTEDD